MEAGLAGPRVVCFPQTGIYLSASNIYQHNLSWHKTEKFIFFHLNQYSILADIGDTVFFMFFWTYVPN